MTFKAGDDWKHYADRRHHTLTCSVRGCLEPVCRSTFSTLCASHKERRRRLGHPTGKSIGRTQFDRYIKVYADPFLDKVADTHTGVINGTAALDRMLAEAKSPDSYGKHLSELRRTDYWLSLMYRRGVTGRDILAGLIAMSVLREIDPALFKSDQHWRIQTISRVMGLGNRKKNQVKPGHIQPLQSGLRTRELLLKRIMQPLGPLVLNATKRILETSAEFYDLDKAVQGADAPF